VLYPYLTAGVYGLQDVLSYDSAFVLAKIKANVAIKDGCDATPQAVTGRGLHSSTFRLNVSALCGIGGAFRGYLGGVYGVSGSVWGIFCVRNGSG